MAPSYIRKRGNKFHYRRRVPSMFSELIGQTILQISLKTDSENKATRRAIALNSYIENYFSSITPDTTQDSAAASFREIVKRAQFNGFNYQPADQVTNKSPLHEIINRAEFSKTAHIQNDTKTVKAIIGTKDKPEITLTRALDLCLEYEQGSYINKSSDQVRKAQNPRKKGIKNLIKAIGSDKPLSQLTRDDLLTYRSWWIDKIKKEDKSTNAANKDLRHAKCVCKIVTQNYNLGLDIDHLFKQLTLKEIQKNRRMSFKTTFIQSLIDTLPSLSTHQEVKMIVAIMADTGARVSEVSGLEAEDIILDTEIPHMKIRPNKIRNLKTPQSERDIPLVGAAFWALQKIPEGFTHYQKRGDLISNVTNKFMRENDLFPTPQHSLYSLRHSFEDRLTEILATEKVHAALMGHKYHRPRYGSGPSLEIKKGYLEKICFNPPSS